MTWLDKLHDAQAALREIEADALSLARALDRVGMVPVRDEARDIAGQARHALSLVSEAIQEKLDADLKCGSALIGSVMSLAVAMGDRGEKEPTT